VAGFVSVFLLLDLLLLLWWWLSGVLGVLVVFLLRTLVDFLEFFELEAPLPVF
jgi:hypothetical protein